MSRLSGLDYSVMVAYFAVLVAVGLYLQRRASSTLEDYFLAGKKMPWWAMGISGMASYVDMAGTMLIVSFLYMLGPRGLYIEFRGGAVLVLTFMLLWSGKWHYRSGCMTGAEWMEYRFGKGWGGQIARLLSSITVIVTTIGMLAYMFKALGLFASMFLPFSPMTCALIIIAAASLYTIVSGFYGVVITDLFQSVIVIAAIILISTLAWNAVGDVGDLGVLAGSVTGSTNWTSSMLPWETTMPRGYEAYQNLALFALFYLIRNIMIGASTAGADPRYFGARSERECGTMTFLWTSLMSLRWPMMIGLAVLGLVVVHSFFPDTAIAAQAADLIRSHLGNLPKERWADTMAAIRDFPQQFPPLLIEGLKSILQDNWQAKLQLLSYEGTINPEGIVPAVILYYIPVGFRGLLVVAFIAAALSGFNSSANMTTAYFTRDIYQVYIRPYAQRRELIGVSYMFTIGLAAAGFLLAYHVQSINQIWGWIIMGLGGGIAVPSFLKFYWWRFTGGGFAVGSAVGIAFAVTQALLWPGLPEWQQFLLVSLVSLCATIIGTYLTEPTDEDVLTRFYATTRPFGFWGPYKRKLSPGVRRSMQREHRNDLCAVPFTLGWQITMFLLPMQLMIRSHTEFRVTLGIFVLCLAGMYWFWYRNLPTHNVPAIAPVFADQAEPVDGRVLTPKEFSDSERTLPG